MKERIYRTAGLMLLIAMLAIAIAVPAYAESGGDLNRVKEIPFEELAASIEAGKENSFRIKVDTQGIQMNSSITLEKGTSLNLDLNGNDFYLEDSAHFNVSGTLVLYNTGRKDACLYNNHKQGSLTPMILLNNRGTVQIGKADATYGIGLDGKLNKNASGAVLVNAGCNLDMYAPSYIKNSYSNVSGGGVYLFGANATFNMYGGTISGCSAGVNGGGIAVMGENAVLNTYDGSISACSAGGEGGGIYLGNNAKAFMEGISLTDCTDKNGNGQLVASSGCTAEYKMRLDPNGGETTQQYYLFGTGLEPAPIEIPTRDGYTYIGSYDINNERHIDYTGYVTSTLSSETLPPAVVYAKWSKNELLTYEMNGHGTAPAPVEQRWTDTIWAAKPPSVIGYNFTSWENKEGSAGKNYFAPEDIIKEPKTDPIPRTLYALWEPNHYTIQFENASLDPNKLHCIYDVEYEVPQTIPVKAGYIFKEWNTNPEGLRTSYLPGDRIFNLTDFDGDVIYFYAIWESVDQTYTIKFSTNGGTGGPANMTGLKEDSLYRIPLEVPTRTGFVFSHWSLKKTGGKDDYFTEPGSEFFYCSPLLPQDGTTTTVLYAQWTRISEGDYRIDTAPSEHGTVSASQKVAASGSEISVIATPNDGYRLKCLIYNDGTEHDITASQSFIMPEHDVTVSAEFEKITPPQTGDSASPMLWLFMCALCLMGLLLLIRKKCK